MFGLPWLGNRLVQIVGGIALLIAALMLAHCAGHSDGVGDERARAEAAQAEADRTQREKERRAEEDRSNQEAIDRAAADARQKEIDDATRNIPDQRTSPRQRARACIELRRQAEAAGRAPPAC